MECDFREAESPNLGWRLKRRHFSDSKINGRETNDSFPPTEPISTGTTNGRYGAGRAVAALTVEWLLSVRSRDLRWDTRQRARRADCRPSRPRRGATRSDPMLPMRCNRLPPISVVVPVGTPLLAPGAGDPVLCLGLDRPTRVGEVAPHLLTHGVAYLLRQAARAWPVEAPPRSKGP